MKSLFFLVFVIAALGLGLAWLRMRLRRITEENEARTNARAQLLGIAATPQQTQTRTSSTVDLDSSMPHPSPHPALDRTSPFTTLPEAAHLFSPPATAAFAGAAAQTSPGIATTPRVAQPIPPGPPDSRRLRKMSRPRFARVGITYFEILGFRARRLATQSGQNAPIDAVLFMGNATVPAMAVRWSRSEGERAGIDEVRTFADACAALRIPRSSFIAQHGLDDEAVDFADTRGVSCFDAETLARRLAETDPIHHDRLHEVSYGER